MKNPTWDDSSSKTEDEMKAEARRLLGEVEGMVERMKQAQARTDRLMEENRRTLQRIQERFDVA